jgi:glucose-6-phosphate 1-dehydrogenase
VWDILKRNSIFISTDFNSPDDCVKLANHVSELEQKHDLNGNRLVYMAVSPHFFAQLTTMIGETHLLNRWNKESDQPWQRIVFEKPFGLDSKSAHVINQAISEWFSEDQVFRIDHYLTKELVSNILMVRFANSMFEPLWNHTYIDHIQITMTESIGLEGRGNYYDDYGVLKDVVQNHMLQLLSLVTMETPTDFSSKEIRDKKSEVLSRVKVTDGILGQYDGYKKEKGVKPDSDTPTYALLRMEVDSPRWKGTPFYGKAGKKLDEKRTSIAIKFKDIVCPLLGGKECPSNYFIIEIAPDATFSLGLNVKAIDSLNKLTQVKMDFCHSCIFGPMTPEAYEIIFEQILRGEQSISVRSDEIEYAWNIYETMIQQRMPLYSYQPGTKGPHESAEFLKKYHIRWRV